MSHVTVSKVNAMLKKRKPSAFWNVIKWRKTTKVKSSLCATYCGEFNGDVMQAVQQSYDKHMVEQKYYNNSYFIGTQAVDRDEAYIQSL